MSRLALKPLAIPPGVTVTVRDGVLSAQGPKGTLTVRVHPDVTVQIDGPALTVTPVPNRKDAKGVRAQWGTVWALVRNAVDGVARGYAKQLELQGVGYRAELSGQALRLAVGFTHPVDITAPSGVTFRVEKNIITVEGADKASVGEAAASIRRVRPPEPYKGKGIRYVGEVVRRKQGKVAGAGATAA